MALYGGRLAPRDRMVGFVILLAGLALLVPIWLTVDANRRLSVPAPEFVITAAGLAVLGTAGGVQVVDVRPLALYRRGHIPGALSLPTRAVVEPASGAVLPPAALREKLAAHGLRPDRPTVVYGDGLRDPALVVWTLKSLGVPDVRLLADGFAGWSGSGRPVATVAAGEPPAPAGSPDSWTAVDGSVAVDWIDVYGGLGKPDLVLIDVRSPGEFAAGHIPGAMNLPLGSLLDAEGRLLPATFLMRAVRRIPREGTLVVYGDDAASSGFVWWFLRSRGFAGVRHLGDTFSIWQAAGFPVEVAPGGAGAAGRPAGGRVGGGCG